MATTRAPGGRVWAARARSCATVSGSPNRSSWSRNTLVSTRTRGRRAGTTRVRAPSSTSNTAASALGGAYASAAATPRNRFAPVSFEMVRKPSARRMVRIIAVVVVLPFVPDTRMTPEGSWAARREA